MAGTGVGSASEQPDAERQGAPATQSEAIDIVLSEVTLRLRAEALIVGFAALGVEEAMGALSDIESIAWALVAADQLSSEDAASIVADTVDALVVRGASWVDARAVDLDVRRLYELAAGTPRPRLRRVVAVGIGVVTSVELWDDRAEARVVAPDGAVAPSLHLDAVPVEDRRLVLRDGGGGTIEVDLTRGRDAAESGTTRRIERTEYVAHVERHAVGSARRDPSVASFNLLRRRVGVVGEALGDPMAASRFDASVSGFDGPSWRAPLLLEVLPVAAHTPFGWLLSVERWGDHWRAIIRADVGQWTAVDETGATYGGDVIGPDVVRFDPALPTTWSWVTVSLVRPDGTVTDVDVVRQ